MIFYVNGEWLPQEDAKVSVLDRGFQYGDGVFETVLIAQGRPFRVKQHLERLLSGCSFLKIAPAFDAGNGQTLIEEAVQKNGLKSGVLRIQVTRGIGPRGYSPRGANHPSVVITLFEAPDPTASNTPRMFHVINSSIRVPVGDRVAGHKSCSKLHNVLARAEADLNQADESLLLNTDGELTEASSSNVFWIEDGQVLTTPLSAGILPGVTRQLIFEICVEAHIPCSERAVTPEELFQSQGVFLTTSTLGIVEVITLENHSLARSHLIGQLFQKVNSVIINETQPRI
ncbi:MAG: ilvE [Verrucomicrobiales bacterium]|nr:ilvE [Verrucomicrobiales bacterium]